MEIAKCTKGHEEQCAHAHSQHCDCACGGKNHGVAVNWQKKTADETRQDVAARHGVITGFYGVSQKRPYNHVYIGAGYLDPAPSQKIVNHSPDGFNWGYGGSGVAQLALAVALYYLPKNKALAKYQDLKWQVFAKLPQGKDFSIRVAEVKKFLK